MLADCILLATMRVKIFFQKCEGDPPKLLSPTDTEEDSSLFTLRKRLEDLNVFKRLGPFQFWNKEEYCRTDMDFKVLNSIRNCIHFIPVAEDLEFERSKRPRTSSIGDSVGTINNNSGDNIDLEAIAGEPESTERPLPDPISTVEDNSWIDGIALKSKLLPMDILYKGRGKTL